jgi:hypothetical protein
MAIELGTDVPRELYLGVIEDGEPAKSDEDGQAARRYAQSRQDVKVRNVSSKKISAR